MRLSELMTQLETLNNDNEAGIDRLDAAQAERDAPAFAHAALAKMRGMRPAAFRPTAGGSIRMSAAEVTAAMDDDRDFDTTVEGLATLPVVTCKAVLAAAGLMEEVGDEEHSASDRRMVATDPVLAGIVKYLKALSDEKRALLMSELDRIWVDAQAACMAARAAEEAANAGRYA